MAITKVGDSQIFYYTGNMQSFTVPIKGLYKLEVYGAQGGSTQKDSSITTAWCGGYAAGGKGGSATGYKEFNVGTVLYIGVGGCPSITGSSIKGGWNGGGESYPDFKFSTGGGGCTHIGTFNSTLQAHGSRSGLYLVAGGGGGAAFRAGGTTAASGGVGGGLSGGSGGLTGALDSAGGGGGSSTAAGSSYVSGTAVGGGFGYGGKQAGTNNWEIVSGGGGGLYGGGNGKEGGGGGGSSYYGGLPAVTYGGTTYSPSTTAGVQSGNGLAKIMLVAVEGTPVYNGSTKIFGIYLGSTKISGMYLGSTKIM